MARNLLAGGAYTLYCPREKSRNFRVVANRIATLFYPKGGSERSAWIDCADEAEVRDNVWDDTLKPSVGRQAARPKPRSRPYGGYGAHSRPAAVANLSVSRSGNLD